MNPIIDIKGEHSAITLILNAMKKLAVDIRLGRFIDSYRIVQILDFLHTFTERCHYEKEELCLYPALLEHDIPWTVETINHLINGHKQAHIYLRDIDQYFDEYLSGNTKVLKSLAASMLKYTELEENHIKIVDTILLPLIDRVLDQKSQQTISFEFKKIQDKNVGPVKHLEFFKLLRMIYSEDEIISEPADY